MEILAKPNYKQNPLQFLPFTAIHGFEGDTNAEEKPFLLSSYNKTTGGQYRSPYTNRLVTTKVDPKTKNLIADKIMDSSSSSSTAESKEVRDIERAANEVWSSYVHLYYGAAGIGSAFLKARSKNATSFEGIFGIHKTSAKAGSWDCVHLVQVDEPKNGSSQYKVDSAVVLSLSPYQGSTISSSLNKVTTKTLKLSSSNVTGAHLHNLGKIMEDVEIEFRSKLERVDIPKSLEIMEAVYKTSRDSVTAALITGIDESEEAMPLTGMGVGASMIGEIANMAKKKQAEGNAFLDAMKAQQQAREASSSSSSSEKRDSVQYSDMKQGLKKTLPSPKPSPVPMSPGVSPALLKANLRKVKVPSKSLVSPPTSPTPEFMDFRNKLKKKGSVRK